MRARTRRLLVEGLIAGLIGYVAISLFYAAFNVMAGESPFYTAELMSRMVLGQGAGGDGVVHVGDVFAWNAIHLVTFVVLGMLASLLMMETELHPAFWYLTFFAFLVGFVVTVAVASFLTAPVAAAVPSWTLSTANGLAALLAVGYLIRVHPRLWTTLQGRGDPEFPAGR